MTTVEFLSRRGTPTEVSLDFLAIAAEEVETVDLIGASKYGSRVCFRVL